MGKINMNLRETNMIGADTREWIVGQQRCPRFKDMGIRLAGWSHAKPGFCFVRHLPDMMQLLACTSGQGQVMLHNQWVPCAAGQVYLTPPLQFHAYRAVQRQPWGLVWVMFSPHHPLWQRHIPTTVQLRSTPVGGLIRVLQGLYDDTADSITSPAVHHWLALLEMNLMRLFEPLRDDERLQPLWRKVESALKHPWNNEQLAEQVGLSSEHLRRLCQRDLGVSPMQHVTQLRMRQAQAMLSIAGLSIVDIARAVGYDNPFAFSTAFKRITGQSPSTYRQSMS